MYGGAEGMGGYEVKSEWIDFIGVLGGILYNISLIVGMVILMIHFNHWWPIFILLFSASVKYTKDKVDSEND